MKKILIAMLALGLLHSVSLVNAGTFTWNHTVIPLDNEVKSETKTKTTNSNELGNNITTCESSKGVQIKIYKGNTALTGTAIWKEGESFTVSYLSGKSVSKGDTVTITTKNGEYVTLPYKINGTCNYY